ncbi:MAG: hypothetical protein HQ504_03995 [Rhodospirillaceae bacterium]|nr:hypothetical protein [Rhodospirillaceae bacterium]
MARLLTRKRLIIALLVLAFALFLGWRFVRPMNIFVVTDNFALPVSTAQIPEPLKTLSAQECATCHQEIFDEWSTTIHSQAWTDPYYQVDLAFDGSQQICLNCHIPLDRQQENLVLGFRDQDRSDPILKPNPDFDSDLQKEGVTCTACHLREGKILGTYGGDDSLHPIRKLNSGNEICVGCHVVSGDQWDTFFRFPPCGTVAEITKGKGQSGEMTRAEVAQLGCVECHMPVVTRPIADGGQVRATRRHLWRGGHDPEMVKNGLEIDVKETAPPASGKRKFTLNITNTGAAHYLPTGTPDRHLVVSMRVLDGAGNVLEEETNTLKRTIMWRPFIIDLWDTRLPRGERRTYDIEFSTNGNHPPAILEAEVRYFLVDEKRRLRIGYDNKEATNYPVFKRRVNLTIPNDEKG